MLAPLVSGLIFVLTFGFILAERVHRTTVALLGAVAMLASGILLGFYSEELALASLDLPTLGLLLGMMALVRMLEGTGFFEYLAIVAAKRSRGVPWLLLLLLGGVTGVASMFLPNVTTVVFMIPVTLIIAEILGLSPVPFLMAEVLMANVGGVATLVGDPPNIIIGSAAGLSFIDFLTHLGPPVAFAGLASVAALLLIYRRELQLVPRDTTVLERLDEREALKDAPGMRKLLIVLAAIVSFFFIHHLLGISPTVIALTGFSLALLWLRPDVEKTLEAVEWNVIIFFAALFVLVGGVEASGLLHSLAQVLGQGAGENLLLTSLVILWGSALLSAVVDNIPFTIAMIPVIQELSLAGINPMPLWWSLAIGAGFGGNGLPIGSTAGVITISLSGKTKTPITTPLWLRSGTPVTLVTCLIASLVLILAFRFYQ